MWTSTDATLDERRVLPQSPFGYKRNAACARTRRITIRTWCRLFHDDDDEDVATRQQMIAWKMSFDTGASVPIESEPKPWILVLTRCLPANRYPLRSKAQRC